jgi:hypothetical protein
MFGKEFIKLIVSAVLIFALFILYKSIRNNIEKQYPKREFETVVPFYTENKPMCMYKRVSCDPNVLSDCANKCNDPTKDSFVCTNMDELGGGANGGGYVCLPPAPDTRCNTTNGGTLLWTGYGMTNQQGWSCFCSQPLVYNGPNCEDKNPSYCSGGTVEFPSLNCTCPANKVKLMRIGSNTPLCASKDPAEGGGAYGLMGNYKIPPNWGNVYYNLNKDGSDDYQNWAVRILRQLNLPVTDDNARKMMDTIKGSEKEIAYINSNVTQPPITSSVCTNGTYKNVTACIINEIPMLSSICTNGTYKNVTACICDENRYLISNTSGCQPIPKIDKLDDNKIIINKICNLDFVKGEEWVRKMCHSSDQAGNEVSTIPGRQNKYAYTDILSEVNYTYYDKTYPSLLDK